MFGLSLPEWTNSPLILIGFVVLIYVVLRVARSIENRSSPPVSKYALEQYAKAHGSGGGGKERRRYPRRAGKSVPVEIQTDRAAGPIHAQVVDFSQGGLGLLAEREVEMGKYIKVRSLAIADAEWVTAEVRYCLCGPEGWVMGCMFLEKVPWKQMQQFSF